MAMIASPCVICGAALQGRQTRYCGRFCKNRDTNHHHQSYLAQQRRGRLKKLELIKQKGGRCARCGYRHNFAALEFHHPDPTAKEFQLDLRSLSNRAWDSILSKAMKCVLLCSNCHAEIHNPECGLQTVV